MMASFSDNFSCCTPSVEKDLVLLDVAHVTRDEETEHSSKAESSQGVQKSETHASFFGSVVGGPTLLQSRAPSSSSSPAHESLREHFRTIVKDFIQKALRGCPCVCIDEKTGKHTNATYSIDSSCKVLTVQTQGSACETVCSLAKVEDIFCLKDDGEKCFPTKVTESLQRGEENLLLMVVFKDTNNRDTTLCIVAESAAAVTSFVESLKVLCAYCNLSK